MALDPLVACGSLTNRMNHFRFAVRVSLATVQLPAAAVVIDGSDDGGRIAFRFLQLSHASNVLRSTIERKPAVAEAVLSIPWPLDAAR